ncbi:ParM/StbA family protein [Clostridium hydrogeniformans]|uniref:ParM/StbA family protein n=1 Tax=Clostridium hydrogeniformans TaxID=349933 RepID=UPI00048613DA|nr:ParM/StbA family protein [Clostridium hydrogeniformans]
MKQIVKIGADVGNDALKIYMDKANFEGRNKLEVMNLVAPGYKRRIIGSETGHLSNLLDVNIEADGEKLGRFFVGGLAFKENRNDLLEKTKRDIKAKNIDTIILLVTGLAYSLYDPSNPIKTEQIALGTLLPTEEYWYDDEDLVEVYGSKLKRSYTVKFNSPRFNNAEITLNVVEQEIQPESVAGHLASIYNSDGSLKKGMKVKNEVHLGIFIGSITTEVSVYEDGEFNSRGFFGIDLGTSDPLDKIITDLGINMNRHQLDHIIRTGKELKVNVNGQAHDLTDKLTRVKDSRFNYFTRQLVNNINKKLSEQGINPSLITKVNLGGGGAITTFDSFKKEIGLANVNLVEDARFANALGALLSIIAKGNEQEVAADEVLG